MISDTLRTWLLGIIAAGMVTALLYALLPRGRMKTIARGCGGVVLLLAVVQPVMELDLGSFTVSYRAYEQEIRELTEQYRQENNRELAGLIEEKTGAYIASKGRALGLSCEVQVETEERDGVPYPCAVTLDIPEDESLAAWIWQELAIDRAHQYWKTWREVDG